MNTEKPLGQALTDMSIRTSIYSYNEVLTASQQHARNLSAKYSAREDRVHLAVGWLFAFWIASLTVLTVFPDVNWFGSSAQGVAWFLLMFGGAYWFLRKYGLLWVFNAYRIQKPVFSVAPKQLPEELRIKLPQLQIQYPELNMTCLSMLVYDSPVGIVERLLFVQIRKDRDVDSWTFYLDPMVQEILDRKVLRRDISSKARA